MWGLQSPRIYPDVRQLLLCHTNTKRLHSSWMYPSRTKLLFLMWPYTGIVHHEVFHKLFNLASVCSNFYFFFSLCIPALEPQVFKTSHWTCLFGHPSRSAFFSMAPVQTAALKGCLLYFRECKVWSKSHWKLWLTSAKEAFKSSNFFFFSIQPHGLNRKKNWSTQGGDPGPTIWC